MDPSNNATNNLSVDSEAVALNEQGFASLQLQKSNKPAYVIYKRHDEEPSITSWRKVFETASSIADRIQLGEDPAQAGVIITCNDEVNFVAALIATWMVGATAIPTTNTFRRNLNDRNTHIYAYAHPDIVLHDLPEGKTLTRLQELAPRAQVINVLETNIKFTPRTVHKIDGSLLQFTSGSTNNPKPVFLSPHEIRSGCEAIADAYKLDGDSTGIHWLPLYHDMGLIGSVVMPLWTGGTSVIMRPSVFVQQPIMWFRLATQWNAHITAAPNFAFEYLLSKMTQADWENVDLSAMSSLIIGGEPVQPATLKRLYAAGPALKLSASAVKPSYGLAEATLLVSQYADGERKSAFSQRHTAQEVTCVGKVVPQVEIEIRDSKTNKLAKKGEVGNIWILGDAVGRVIPSDKSWKEPCKKVPINTGDTGFEEAGYLYLTGRQSNVLIIRGANFYAEDIESAVLATQPPGMITGIAAISIADPDLGTDLLYLFIELASKAFLIPDTELNAVLSRAFGLRAKEVISVRSRTLPRTSSGKIIRRTAKDLYVNGKLDRFRFDRT
jgi:acyl-CoA synthetase (AMP-forming)/AMP-acid ligase II